MSFVADFFISWILLLLVYLLTGAILQIFFDPALKLTGKRIIIFAVFTLIIRAVRMLIKYTQDIFFSDMSGQVHFFIYLLSILVFLLYGHKRDILKNTRRIILILLEVFIISVTIMFHMDVIFGNRYKHLRGLFLVALLGGLLTFLYMNYIRKGISLPFRKPEAVENLFYFAITLMTMAVANMELSTTLEGSEEAASNPYNDHFSYDYNCSPACYYKKQGKCLQYGYSPEAGELSDG